MIDQCVKTQKLHFLTLLVTETVCLQALVTKDQLLPSVLHIIKWMGFKELVYQFLPILQSAESTLTPAILHVCYHFFSVTDLSSFPHYLWGIFQYLTIWFMTVSYHYQQSCPDVNIHTTVHSLTILQIFKVTINNNILLFIFKVFQCFKYIHMFLISFLIHYMLPILNT